MHTLDIGCGSQKRGTVGIDAHPGPNIDHVLRMGFQDIPYPDNHFDAAFMIHAIEHIPFVLWDHGGYHTYPMVRLLREVFRVLKPDACFNILTLCYPDERCFSDPTHVSVWTQSTINHFVGKRDSETGNENDERAGLRVPFELLCSHVNSDGLLEIGLRKPK